MLPIESSLEEETTTPGLIPTNNIANPIPVHKEPGTQGSNTSWVRTDNRLQKQVHKDLRYWNDQKLKTATLWIYLCPKNKIKNFDSKFGSIKRSVFWWKKNNII